MIFDPDSGAAVSERWLGMSGTVAAVRARLGRLADVQSIGFESWGGVAETDAVVVAAARYADGATPDEVAALAARFPTRRFWWMFNHGF